MKANRDVAWYIKGRKKPIATSTKATSDLIAELYKEHKDLREVYKQIHYDEEAKKIVQKYIESGIYEIAVG